VAESLQNIAVIGAAINGLVAANYVQRAGPQVTLLERSDRDGGACEPTLRVGAPVAETASLQVGIGRAKPNQKEPSLRILLLFGSGGVICAVPTVANSVRLK
jgi:monoamine oxidase